MSQGLYIHIPFCIKKCNYCDFLSFPASDETINNYCLALEEEIIRTARALEEEKAGTRCAFENDVVGPAHSLDDLKSKTKISSIFFGGGTPSILLPEQIARLFVCIREYFCIDDEAEISIEANPGTITPEKLAAWKEAGINRLSIGLQSTDESLLKTLGRIHNFRQFTENYKMARAFGFDNINIDLISSLPGQTLSDWITTLDRVVALKPDHISAYSLIIEEGTPFSKNEDILESLPGEDTDREIYEVTKKILSDHGYCRYEISNYALKGKECRHNTGYWDGSSYLGLGLGAASYYNKARFSNDNNLCQYLKKPFVPLKERMDYHKLTREEEMEDRMIFGLRMMRGISCSQFERDFGISLDMVYGDIIRKYQRYGLIEEKEGRVRLTDRGIDVSNLIFEDLLL